MEALLRFQDVSFSYHTLDGETDVLSHISFEVKEGDFLAIVGPSGCGKSTILSLIAGLLKPEEGSIFFHEQLAAAHGTTAIGYMLQKDHLFEWRNIRKNAMLGLEIQREKDKRTYGLCRYAFREVWIGGIQNNASVSAVRRNAAAGGARPDAGASAAFIIIG